MENIDDQNTKIEKFTWWDWLILVCGILFILFGLFLLFFNGTDWIGPLVWGLALTYYKQKKLRKSKLK